MERLTTVGRMLFAFGLLGLGVEHFIFGEFVTGRAPPWPESLPGGAVWAYLMGIVILATVAAMLFRKHARAMLMAFGALIFVWSFLRQLPIAAADTFLGGTWTTTGKAMVFFGGSWAVASTIPLIDAQRNTALTRLINKRDSFVILGRICLGLFMILTGTQHFLYTEFVASLIPGWFPGDAVFWTWFAGVALISGGVGLIVPQTAWLAALFAGVMIFSWVWLVHLPRVFVSRSDSIAIFEAIAFSGLAFVLTIDLPYREGRKVREDDFPNGG